MTDLLQIKGQVFNIERHALHDGPGIRTLVFLSGCPLNCLWCANPEGHRIKNLFIWKNQCTNCGRCIEACPNGAVAIENSLCTTDRSLCNICGSCIDTCPMGARKISGKEMTVGEVLEIVRRDSVFYKHSGGGITLSGGEPFCQPEFVHALLKQAKAEGINTAIETCGAVPWKDMEQSIEYLDNILFDVKHIDSEKHKKFTGMDNSVILENFQKAGETGAKIIARVPIIPTFNDTLEEAESIAGFIAKVPGVVRIDILPFHKLAEPKHSAMDTTFKMSDCEPLKADLIDNLAAEFKKVFKETYIEV